jgi:hypothetical protein
VGTREKAQDVLSVGFLAAGTGVVADIAVVAAAGKNVIAEADADIAGGD